MRKPVIGITAAHFQEELKTFPRHFYVESIRSAGGIPLILPPVYDHNEASDYINLIDGLLLTGGGDISPIYLNESPMRGIGSCTPQRDYSEILLTKQAMQKEKAVLGICKGIQILAVAAGGKIYQDIPSQYPGAIQHSQSAPRQFPWHQVELYDSLLFEILGKKIIQVNSFHHQAVREVPDGFEISAKATDGIIEGIAKKGTRFCAGVQWHPESMENDENSKILFEAFIIATQPSYTGG